MDFDPFWLHFGRESVDAASIASSPSFHELDVDDVLDNAGLFAMEQQSSTSTVTVEYFDPHDVYKLLAPGLIPRLPLHNLHWQSHSGPLRSIDTLHVELVQGKDVASGTTGLLGIHSDNGLGHVAGSGSNEAAASSVSLALPPPGGGGGGGVRGSQRRHQIPGIRSTPYLKLLLVRCDDNDSYKSSVRSEIREWIKTHASPPSKKASGQENHDAFEWLIVHVVIPNTVASTQPRTHHKSDSASQDKAAATSRWRTGSTPLMEKLRTDFNGSAKGAQDRITQIRIGINDVPYHLLPRVVPAVPTGYAENEQDAENAWGELIGKLKSSILTSFDLRVTHYEEDIREKDAQRSLPGWNFCTFFMLKEGLARGFENVGLVEDALVGYDELSAGLDAVIHEQFKTGSPEAHGGAMLNYTKELKLIAETRGVLEMTFDEVAGDDKKEQDSSNPASQSHSQEASRESQFDEIPISSMKKAYRDMIMENKVSVFDFRCYIFSRQIALLLRLGNAVSSREELLAKLRRQQQSILTGEAPMAPPPPSQKDEPENLAVFAEICERTLQFIPNVSQVLRRDIVAALLDGSTHAPVASGGRPGRKLNSEMEDTVENMVASFAFSVAQQILAQTSTKALPIPPSTLSFTDGQGSRMSIPEPKTMMHPQRNSSLYVRANVARPPPSPGVFPGPGRQMPPQGAQSHFVKPGLEDLAARRAELYMLSRTILTSLGKKWGWSNGWDRAPVIGEADVGEMENVSLDDDDNDNNHNNNNNNNNTQDDEKGIPNDDGKNADYANPDEQTWEKNESRGPEGEAHEADKSSPSVRGIDCRILRTATGSEEDFHRLYEILTDKAMRHFSVAGHDHAVHSSIADLAVLKFHVKEFKTAASYFDLTAPFFGEGGWNVLELAMLAMYAQCLDELDSKVDYVGVALRLLTKSCAAERERLREKLGRARGHQRQPDCSDALQLRGVVAKLCQLAETLGSEVQAPLTSFFANIGLVGPPEYHAREDGCSLSVEMRSLLPEPITVDLIKLRIVSADGGASKERFFETAGAAAGPIVLNPGRNTIKLECNSVVAGRYKIANLSLSRTNFLLHFGRDTSPSPPAAGSDIFKHDDVVLFQRTSAFDVALTTSRHTSLDKSNNLELRISTGWNAIKSCDIRVRPATGGVRFMTNQAAISTPSTGFAKPPESGTFSFAAIPPETHVTLLFPYSMEQEVTEVSARIEASYVTEAGKAFSMAKALAVPVSLALGVNVQDVFKHRALFSRFNVSTASSSPLRLYSSELLGSELFESSFGVAASSAVTVFPKQPASLLYRVHRKPGTYTATTGLTAAIGKARGSSGFDRPPSARVMHLKLRYSVLETEVEQRIRQSLVRALRGSPLEQYSKLVAASVLAEARNRVRPQDLERAALTGQITTSHLHGIRWKSHFDGLGRVLGHGDNNNSSSSSSKTRADASTELSAFLRSWLRRNPAIAISARNHHHDESQSNTVAEHNDYSGNSDDDEPCSIVIPVEIPSVSMVHTADIRITTPPSSMLASADDAGTPAAWTNQMLTAALHLRWTRTWRTEPSPPHDQEYSYEVSAPADTWLLGGRRKGHFVIPGITNTMKSHTKSHGAPGPDSCLPTDPHATPASASASDSDADPTISGHIPPIPLVLIPLREGWLPYPTIEIREVPSPAHDTAHLSHTSHSSANDNPHAGIGCEIDLRNLGETVRVVSNRAGVTVSLDASGPAGGPLTFESEGMTGLAGRIVA